MNTRILASILIALIVVSVASSYMLVHRDSIGRGNTRSAVNTPVPGGVEEEEEYVTLPFSAGSTFTLYRVVVLLGGDNGTYVLSEHEEILVVEEPGFPASRARTLSGESVLIPTIYLGVPKELASKDFYVPVYTRLIGEALCIHLAPESWGEHAGGTPGACKRILVVVSWDERGMTTRTVILSGVGGAPYAEYIYVVARSVNGETRVRPEKTCLSYHSPEIMLSTPGLYYFDSGRATYVDDTDYSKYRPLLVVLKTRENESLWRTLLLTYTGYVLLVSPLLSNIDEVPELDRLISEKVVRVD